MEARKDQLRKRLASASERTVRVTMTFDHEGEAKTASYDLPLSDVEEAGWMTNAAARESSGIIEVLIGGDVR